MADTGKVIDGGLLRQAQRRLFPALGLSKGVADQWEDHRSFQGAVSAKAGEVLLYGPIVPAIDEAFVSEWLESDLVVSLNSFKARLDAVKGDVTVRINSPGGDAWEASGMMALLAERREAGDKVKSVVDGLAASAATVVMVQADQIDVSALCSIMIHKTQTMFYGNSDDHMEIADFLDRFDRGIAAAYSGRMEKDEDEVMALLAEETWFTATEAVAAGLADRVVGAKPQREKDAELFARRDLRLAAFTA